MPDEIRGKAVVRWAPLAAVLSIAACSGADAGERTIPEGRYRYVATHPARGGSDSIRLDGVLEITESTPDSITGVWAVPQLQPDLDLGGWRGDAYEVMASPTYFGVLTSRLRPEGTWIRCEGEYTWVADGGVERSVPVTCSLSPDAGERPEMPPTGAEDPIVRPIDADTVPPRGLSPDEASGPRPDPAGGAR